MSDYRAPAFNPMTKRVENADYIDERDQIPCSFGAQFDDGQVAHPSDCDLIAAGKYIAELEAAASTSDAIREALMATTKNLLAAISLLKASPTTKRAAASDKMFDVMISDYEKAAEKGIAAIRATKSKGAGGGE